MTNLTPRERRRLDKAERGEYQHERRFRRDGTPLFVCGILTGALAVMAVSNGAHESLLIIPAVYFTGSSIVAAIRDS